MNKRILILSLFLFCSGIVYPQDSIVFLQLRLKNETVTLVKTTVRPGILKQQRVDNDQPGIFFEVLSQNGSLLFKNNLKDPSIQHLEYEDSENPGRLLSKDVRQNDVEFTVRIPYKREMSRVEFYRTHFIRSTTDRINKINIGTADLRLKGER